jgi:hypothetical protein
MRENSNDYINPLAIDLSVILRLIEKIKNFPNPHDRKISALIPYLNEQNSQIISAINEIMIRALKGFLINDSYTPPTLRGADLCVFENENVQVNIGIINDKTGNNKYLFSLPSDTILMNLGRISFEIIPHEIPPECDLEVFDTSHELGRGRVIKVDVGEVCFIDAKVTVPEMLVSGDLLVLKIFSTQQQQLGWAYKKSDLMPVFALAVTANVSRLQVISELFLIWSDKFGFNQTSVDILKKIATNKAHFVRWTAIQCLFKMSPENGKIFLEAALEDKHPHVRQAAKLSWNRLYNNNGTAVLQ